MTTYRITYKPGITGTNELQADLYGMNERWVWFTRDGQEVLLVAADVIASIDATPNDNDDQNTP
ncbi:MAG: hypothetical protein OXC13_11490 [Caldilineaceae bacterium]|nr:hypothetical protein [Caldilineaceae bacterium]